MTRFRRATTSLVTVGFLLASVASEAQRPPRLPRVGFLGLASAATFERQLDAFRSGLRDVGYIEGKNVVVDYRWAEGTYERLADLAGALAAKRATTTIPIVVATSADAVTSGLVESLARPGGNLTGSTYFIPELNAKRLEILEEPSNAPRSSTRSSI